MGPDVRCYFYAYTAYQFGHLSDVNVNIGNMNWGLKLTTFRVRSVCCFFFTPNSLYI